jgi:hypothetical protein
MFGLAEAKAFIVLYRTKKVRPRISPRPDPIGTRYIRSCLQFLHCVTLIAERVPTMLWRFLEI